MTTNPSPWERRRSMPATRSATIASSPSLPQRHPQKSSNSGSSPPTQYRPMVMVLGGMAAALTLMVQWPSRPSSEATPPNLPCQQIVQPQSALSREALLELLAVPERESMQTVRDIVHEPYCTLPPLEIRAGVASQREVFPLAFDPQTWLVVLYEDNEYAGYAFQVNR